MISFKSFVTAIHEAIINASDTLIDKNEGLLEKYFEKKPGDVKDDNGNFKEILSPKSVILDYPHLTQMGELQYVEVHVPLITLVPLTMSQVEKATLTADFDIEIIDGEVQLNFTNKKNGGLFQKKSKSTRGKLEITIKPQESAEGLKILVEGYDAILKRQIS